MATRCLIRPHSFTNYPLRSSGGGSTASTPCTVVRNYRLPVISYFSQITPHRLHSWRWAGDRRRIIAVRNSVSEEEQDENADEVKI